MESLHAGSFQRKKLVMPEAPTIACEDTQLDERRPVHPGNILLSHRHHPAASRLLPWPPRHLQKGSLGLVVYSETVVSLSLLASISLIVVIISVI